MSAPAFLAAKAATTERALEAYFTTLIEIPDLLRDAMRYSLFGGGKRLRPALTLGASEIISGKDEPALPAACALEMIHTYSLIHDDLPSMDNDDLRRGKPTSHKVYGEAIAILAGDALLTMAFDMASRTGNAAVIAEIARAAGAAGMVGGQVLDLQSEGKRLTLDDLRRLHSCKTGALIRVAVRTGAILGGAAPDQLDALTVYGEHIGLAFQIADDVLDITSTEEVLGKPIGSDVHHAKSTYPALVGMEESRRLATGAVNAACGALANFGSEADTFRELARYVVERDR